MTNDDAIKILKLNGWGYTDGELKEATQMAVEALEKQIPKKSTYIDRDNGLFECPVCKTMIESSSDLDTWHYCMNCGQALDWSEVEE